MSKNATLQADGTWVVRDFTAEEETDYAAMKASSDTIKKAEEELNKALSNQKAYEEENIKVRNYLSKMRTQAIEIDSLVSK